MPCLEIHYTANNDLKLLLFYYLPLPAARIINSDAVYMVLMLNPRL